MANLNKVLLIGRLTHDPEEKSFNSGAKQAKFSFVVNNRAKGTNGQWEDAPMFITVEAWNRGENGKLADIVMQYTHKGSEIAVEGRLFLDQWDDKTTGQKRQKHKIVADSIQLLGKKDDGRAGPSDVKAQAPADEVPEAGSNGEDIPF